MPPLIGGFLIGASAALFLVFNGRLAGISSILGGQLHPTSGEIGWRMAFLAGLLIAPPVYVAFGARCRLSSSMRPPGSLSSLAWLSASPGLPSAKCWHRASGCWAPSSPASSSSSGIRRLARSRWADRLSPLTI